MAFDLNKYVLYLDEWKVLICLHEKCQYALTSEGIWNHYMRHHKASYDLCLRRQIMSYVNELQLTSPSEIIAPTNIPAPISGLRVWKGWRCNVCSKVGAVINGASMKVHCRDAHGWTSSQSNY